MLVFSVIRVSIYSNYKEVPTLPSSYPAFAELKC